MLAIVLSVIASMLSLHVSSQFIEEALCMRKCLCLPIEGTVSCHENDHIRAIPTNIEKSITRFIVQRGKFDSPTLYGHNLTGLEQLTYLKIIYYNLHYIAPRAFLKMKKLTYLDLSHNELINIASFAFSGLALIEFHIMENTNIKFQPKSFDDMTAQSINMRSNNMSSLSFDLFKRTEVKSLFLYNNNIRTVNPQFQLLFNESDTLFDVSNNPLICDCSLSWLAEVLAIRFSNKKYLIHSKKINISCHKPDKLSRKELMFLRPNDLKCTPLRIEAVKIHFNEKYTQLTCVSRVGGYKRPKLTWLYYTTDFDRSIIEGSKEAEHVQENEMKSTSLAYNTINLTKNYFKSGRSKLVCLATTDDDLVQRLEVHIHRIQQALVAYKSNQTIQEPGPSKETTFLFIKHFSILEMLGAVLGTFSSTFIGLLVLLRYFKSYQDKLMNKTDFIDLHKNLNSVKPYWYVPHGNSSTYSMPNSNPDYENPAHLDNVLNLTNVYPTYTFGRSGFLDYKTQNPVGS